jgi:hypothetical protein
MRARRALDLVVLAGMAGFVAFAATEITIAWALKKAFSRRKQ